jgi:uncharacterized protein YcaQ
VPAAPAPEPVEVPVPVAARRSEREVISADDARRLALRAQGLMGAIDRRAGVRGLLRALGAVQLDSVSVVARSHELVAYSRLGAVGREAVERGYWGQPPRTFEYVDHGACVLPMETWPLFAASRREARARVAEEGHPVDAVEAILSWLEEDGPLTAAALTARVEGDGRRASAEVRRVLEALWLCGEVACVERHAWRRVFDLPERIVPRELLLREPDDSECARRLIGHAGARLGVGTVTDLAQHHRMRVGDVQAHVTDSGLIPVRVEGWGAQAWAHPSALESLGTRGRHRTTLLSPFDSLLWDRARTERLFGFSHRVETYVARERRVHGFFVMPLLARGRLVGRADPERDGDTLLVRRASMERGGVTAMAGALLETADWVGCSSVRVERTEPAGLLAPLRSAIAKGGG